MAEDRWEDTFRVSTGQGIGIGVADTAGDHAQQHFTGFWHGHVDFDDFQGFLGFEGNGSTGLDHQRSPDSGSIQSRSVIQRLLMNNQAKDKTLLPYRDNQ